MREQRYGRVLNTCSAAGILGAERMSNFGSAKTGLIGFTRVLAAEGADRNIKVNAIAQVAYTRMLAHSVDTAGQQDDASTQVVLDDAPDTSRDSSSAGRRGSTVPNCRSRRCVIISTRSATKPAIPCPADPLTR